MKEFVEFNKHHDLNESDVLVSVICVAYNHEKYIRSALDGFIMIDFLEKHTDYGTCVHNSDSLDTTTLLEKQINVTESSLPPFDEYIDELKSIWESKWLTNDGEKHRQLEAELDDYLKTDNIQLVANGHLALELALEALITEKTTAIMPVHVYGYI